MEPGDQKREEKVAVEEKQEEGVEQSEGDKKNKKSKRGGKKAKVEREKKINKNDYAAVKRWRKKNPEKVSAYQKKHWKTKYNLSRKRFKTCSKDAYTKPEVPGANKQEKRKEE